MKEIFKNRKILLSILAIIFISFSFVGVFWELNNMTLNIPISYYGGDDYAALKNAKTIVDTGWVLENSNLGAPYGATYYGYPVTATSNFDNLTLKLLLLITKDIAISVNLQFILLFPLISISSYIVMISLRINNFISIASSLTYAFLPYIFLRGMSHTVLSAYQFVPLSILLCIWIFIDDNFFIISKDFFKYRNNIIAIFITLLIANNGIAYYPFFACFFLIVSGFIKTADRKQIKFLLRSLSLVFCLLLFFSMTLLPVIAYKLGNIDAIESTSRSRADAEVYGLKLFQLYLPVNSHGINILDKLIMYYNSNTPLVNENSYSYLGIPGAIGFTILLCALFINGIDKIKMDKILFLSRLNISAILLGTIGGFGSMIAILITPMIRAYNRISIFIAYISILGLAILLNEIREKIIRKKLYISIIVLFFMFGIIEQFPGNIPNYEYVNSMFNSDKNFVESIETSVSSGAMIFQLPYHAFPESGPVNNMNDYHLLSPYLHSNNLKWSYGAVKGSKADLWNMKVSSLSMIDMVKTISIAGFEGIYIDKRAYTEEDYNDLSKSLSEILHVTPIISDNKQLIFFNMGPNNKEYYSKYTSEELNHIRQEILNFQSIKLDKGFSTIEGEAPNQWIWLSDDSRIVIENYSERVKKYNLNFNIFSGYIENSKLEVCVNDKSYFYNVNSNGTNVNIEALLNRGENIINFKTDAQRIEAPGDPRELYLRITDFDFLKNKVKLK